MTSVMKMLLMMIIIPTKRRHDTCHQREAVFTADSGKKAQAHEDGRKDAKLPLDLDHPQRTPGIPGVVVTFEHKA